MARITKGTKFHDTYADGRPEWEVVKSRGKGVWECKISETSIDYAGVVRLYSTAQINGLVGYDNALDSLFKRSNDFWANRKVGEVLHYHNAFGAYVRGTVVHVDGKNQLRPTAMVGNWSAHDLPKYRPDGSVHNPYHAARIVEGNDVFQPNEGNIFESPNFSRPMGPQANFDPRTAAPINLSLPPLGKSQQVIAEHERLRNKLVEILRDEQDVFAALSHVATELKQAGVEA